MRTMDTRQATAVTIDWVTGDQTKLFRGDRLVGHAPSLYGSPVPIDIEQVSDVLADPDGWVQWESSASFDDPDEEWSEPRYDTPCLTRLYARNIVSVMLLWEDE